MLHLILFLSFFNFFLSEEELVEGPVIGIDLGTTYSAVGIFRGQTKVVEIIANDQGNRITPSVVAFTDTEILVGEAAKNQIVQNPENTVYEIKRLIGREYTDKEVQRDIGLFPFKIVNKNNKPFIEVTYRNEKKIYSPEEISSMILRKMADIAENYLSKKVVNAVITVPAYFNDSQRQATKDAGRIAGLNVLRIINEPTAAAMAYGLNKIKEERNIMVFDLGGGTFDVSMLSIDNNVFEVIATSGDTHLGGSDFDERITQFLVDVFKKKHNKDITKDKRAMTRMRKEAERAKRSLSVMQQDKIEIENLYDGIDFSFVLTRARFEELNMDLFKSTIKPVKQVLDDSKLTKGQVHDVVLVGGSTRIPKVQNLLKEFFNNKEPNRGINPDEAVAHGAAVQGGVLAKEEGTEEILLVDSTSLTLGIETVGGVMTSIIERGTRLPTKKAQTFSTYQDNQPMVTVKVYEGERPMTSQNHLLGTFDLDGIQPAPRGVPQIEVVFDVDVNGIINVTAEDKKSGKSEQITITSDKGRLTPDEIERMIKEAEDRKEEDKLTKEKVDAKIKLEGFAYQIKSDLNDKDKLQGKISEEDKKIMIDVADDLLSFSEANRDASKEEYEKKLKDAEEIVNPINDKYNKEDDNDDDIEEDEDKNEL